MIGRTVEIDDDGIVRGRLSAAALAKESGEEAEV